MSRIWRFIPFFSGAINLPFIVLNWGRPVMALSIGAAVFCWAVGGWTLLPWHRRHLFCLFGHEYRNGHYKTCLMCDYCPSCQTKHKEFVEECSQSQQPTSGTSQSPSQSQYQSGGIVGLSLTVSSGANPSPPSQSPKVFPSETRLTPVVGFRSWHARPFHRVGIGPSYWLGSFNDQYGVWKPGRNRAQCFARSHLTFEPIQAHEAGPQPECTCGFYVLTDFDEVPFNSQPTTRISQTEWGPGPPMMVGAVVGWGRVIQHGDQGWRAEFAQVIALLDCKVSDEHLQITHQIAEVYGVPVVGRKALELLAKEYGDPLPTLHNSEALI